MKTSDTFVFFDPPYFKKGRELYSNYLSESDHLDLSKMIINSLRDHKWIVTYDNAAEIQEMYSSIECREYYLQYTLQSKVKATELIGFSPALVLPAKPEGINFV